MKKIIKSKNGLKNNEGITLVALIITVILMLILAGVAISAVIDSDGLFRKSREATKEYENAAKTENKTISNLMNYIERYISGTPTVAEIASSNVSATAFTLTANGKDDIGIEKYEFYVDDKLEKTVTSDEESVTYNATGKTLGTTYTYKVKVYDKVGNYKESEEIKVTSTEIFVENGTVAGTTTGTYNNPIIPKGFAPISENGANWGTTTGYQSGLVITDAINEDTGKSIGNEFVWVPVDGTNVKFEKQAWYKADGNTQYVYDTTVNAENVSEELPTELTPDASGVIPNGGFYIARFETGAGTVSKAGVNPYASVDWSTAKSAAEGKYGSTNSNYGAVSTLIYGAQWDTALKFIQAYNIGEAGYATYATNSVGYGNYSGTDGAGDTFSSTSAPTSCGAASQFRQKNIYDMAGNVWEWTMETPNSSSSRRVRRGGSYGNSGSDVPAGCRYYYAATNTAPGLGFRLGLYIKGQTES